MPADIYTWFQACLVAPWTTAIHDHYASPLDQGASDLRSAAMSKCILLLHHGHSPHACCALACGCPEKVGAGQMGHTASISSVCSSSNMLGRGELGVRLISSVAWPGWRKFGHVCCARKSRAKSLLATCKLLFCRRSALRWVVAIPSNIASTAVHNAACTQSTS